MTHPPDRPGYPSAQPPFATHSHAPGGPSRLQQYLTAAVAALGLAVYLSSFGPYFAVRLGADLFAAPTLLYLGIVALILAALLAGVALLPKQTVTPAPVAALSVLGFLLVLEIIVTVPRGVSIKWGIYAITVFGALQAVAAVTALLFNSGVIGQPAGRARYEQPPYGAYGGPGSYYGPSQGPPQHSRGPQQQRPGGYPAQYGGGHTGPSTGGFSASDAQSGTPTPPTGFPAYGQPQQQSSSPSTDSGSDSGPRHSQGPSEGSSEGSSGPQSGQTPS